MAQERLAQAQHPHDQAAEPTAFDATDAALLALLRSFARGRDFLERYAKSVRHDDIAAALAALARIEAHLQREATPPAAPAPAEAAPVEAAAVEAFEIPSDEAYVPYEMELVESSFEPEPPVAIMPQPAAPQPAAPLPAEPELPPAQERVSRPSADELLAQVMALSPEERIALFS